MPSPHPLLRRIQSFPWPTLYGLAMAVFYALFTVGVVQTRGLFDYLGADYASFRSAAAIVREGRLADLYDLALQERFQRELFDAYATGPMHSRFVPAPMVYLPPFVLLFLPLLLFEPVPGFIVWNVLCLAVLAWYLWRFMRAVGLAGWPSVLVYTLLSAPVLGTWLFGQVSVWLVIPLGEFVLAARRGRPFVAGLWLAGLLLKPQALILLVPALLLGRQWKTAAGLAAAGLATAGLSLLLVGWKGIVELAQLLVGFGGGMASTNPHVMTNWRSLATHLELLIPAPWAGGIAWAGLLLTAGAALALWLRPGAPGSPRFHRALLGVYAATCAVTWHAHVTLSLPLVPLLVLLRAPNRLPRPLLLAWLWIPALVFPPAFVAVPALAHNLMGLSLFALNLGVLAWAVRDAWRDGELGVRPGATP